MNFVSLDSKNLDKFSKLNNGMKNLIIEEENKINSISLNPLNQQEQTQIQTQKVKEYIGTNEEIIEKLKREELEELNKIMSDIDTIQEINKLLVEHLQEQKENLSAIETSVVNANVTLDNSNLELIQAKENQVSYFYTRTGAVVLVTTAVACPVTWIVGIKAGLIAGIASLVTSLVTVNVIP